MFSGIYVTTQLVGCLPQFLLKAEVRAVAGFVIGLLGQSLTPDCRKVAEMGDDITSISLCRLYHANLVVLAKRWISTY
jgi:hypothetical protein